MSPAGRSGDGPYRSRRFSEAKGGCIMNRKSAWGNMLMSLIVILWVIYLFML